MIITPHMLVGAAIGAQVSNIWAAFCFGLISHYVLDFLPHWDYLPNLAANQKHYLKKIVLDFILGTIIVLFLVWSEPQKLLIMFGVGAALLPDFIEFLYQNLGIKWLKPLHQFHYKIHYWKKLSFAQGMPCTIIVCLLAVYFLWG